MPFNNVSDPEMVTKSAAVADAFTKEIYAHLLSLLPTPETYTALHNQYEASYAAALKGDPEKVKACEADRSAVNQNMSILYGLAKLAVIKDPTLPEKLGFGEITDKKTAVPAVVLTAVHDFQVFFDRDGHMYVSASKVPGARGYQVWACDGDPNVDGNWKLVTSSPSCRKIAITGLNRANNNWLKIRAMRGTGAGPWSTCVMLTPD
jgi:hypothetical protein